MKLSYETLDAILIVMSMAMVAYIIWALTFVTIPQSQLPIISGLGGTVLGVVLTYAAFRWQGTGDKSHTRGLPGTASVSIEATAPATDSVENGDKP